MLVTYRLGSNLGFLYVDSLEIKFFPKNTLVSSIKIIHLCLQFNSDHITQRLLVGLLIKHNYKGYFSQLLSKVSRFVHIRVYIVINPILPIQYWYEEFSRREDNPFKFTRNFVFALQMQYYNGSHSFRTRPGQSTVTDAV